MYNIVTPVVGSANPVNPRAPSVPAATAAIFPTAAYPILTALDQIPGRTHVDPSWIKSDNPVLYPVPHT